MCLEIQNPATERSFSKEIHRVKCDLVKSTDSRRNILQQSSMVLGTSSSPSTRGYSKPKLIVTGTHGLGKQLFTAGREW